MAKLAMKKFVPQGEERDAGELPMSQVEILEALAKYKAQNPTKYAQKKEALFKRYNLKEEDVRDEVLDEDDKELKELTAKAKKK